MTPKWPLATKLDTHVADLQVSLFKVLGGSRENAPLPVDVPPTGSSIRMMKQ
jgi:hypothetical protein